MEKLKKRNPRFFNFIINIMWIASLHHFCSTDESLLEIQERLPLLWSIGFFCLLIGGFLYIDDMDFDKNMPTL